MRFIKIIIPIILISSCTEQMEFTEIDIASIEVLEIAYQGATDAIINLEDAIHDEATEVEIEAIDSLFHMHFENYLKFSENYSHTFLSDHYHDMGHGMMAKDDDKSEGGHNEVDEDDGHGDGQDDSNHHVRGEHHAEDHEDMEHLMEEHDEMDIHK